MKIQDQACTLEQAKKLNELGVKQGVSVFFFDTGANDNILINTGFEKEHTGFFNFEYCFSAFTVAELGIMLPSETLTIRRGSEGFPNWEWENEGRQTGWGCFASEAAARADHLIMLLENKLITVDEVNDRLQ